MKRNLPTPVEVAAALRLVDADYDEWLAVQTPLTDRPFPILTGMFVDTASLSNEQFTELSDCYMYALRHGWASWERKHGKTPTRPTGDQVAVFPPQAMLVRLLDFRVVGFREGTYPLPAPYWRDRLGDEAWTDPLDLAGIYVAAFRHGWFLRSEEDNKK